MPGQAARPTPAAGPWAEDMFTVGVTGTNGKTSTTHLIASIFRAAKHSTLRVGTLGVDLDGEALPRGKRFTDFLATMEQAATRGCRHAVLEATSHGLAQGYAKAWRFDLGVFTNLSPDHFKTHGSWEHYLAAKAQLFVHLGPGRTAVLNAADRHALFIDQAMAKDIVRRYYAAPSRGPSLTPADLEAAGVELSPDGTRILLRESDTAAAFGGALSTQMIGAVFSENALAAALAGLAGGIAPAVVREGLANCPVVPGRFEVLDHGDDRACVVVDYAHSPDALVHTCATARALTRPGGRVLLVFGAGGDASSDKREPMGEVVGTGADWALVTNDNPRTEDPEQIAAMLVRGLERGTAETAIELDRRRAIVRALEQSRAGDVLVIAGKGHETGQVVGNELRPFSDVEVVRGLLGHQS